MTTTVAATPVIHPHGETGRQQATRTVISAFGVLAALAGIEHGVGEILQGAIAPPSVVFQSWPDTSSFAILNGEPAMTLIPNLLATGSWPSPPRWAVGVWSVTYAGHRYGGLVLIVLSVLLLVVGVGFGPPLIGIILGLAATRAAAPARPAPGRVQHLLGRLWPWFLVAGFLGLIPGTVVLYELFEVSSAGLVYTLSAVAFGGLVLALTAARAHDRSAHTPSNRRSAIAEWASRRAPTG